MKTTVCTTLGYKSVDCVVDCVVDYNQKARNHCQDVDNCGDEDHCLYHLGIDHCQTGNHCPDREHCLDREHCQNGNEHADR